MDIGNSRTLLSEAVAEWSFPAIDQVILPVAVNQGDKLRSSAVYMGKSHSLQTDLQGLSAGQALTQHFGTLDDQHGLSMQSQPLGIKPTEPQLTAAIAYYLKADGNRQKSQKRTQVFLHALLQGGCHQTNLLYAVDHLCDARQFQVESEYSLSNRRKMDLLIHWEMPGGKPYVVAIEAKFGHQVTVGQLPDYRQRVIRMAKGGDYTAILLTLEGARSTRNKDWTPMTWKTLLTRWEKATAPDADESFTLLKRLIWDKL